MNQDLEYRRLDALRVGNACAKCSSLNLQLSWSRGAWAIFCRKCGPDPPLAYDPAVLARYQAGEQLPEHHRLNAIRIIARLAQREVTIMAERGIAPTETALTLVEQSIRDLQSLEQLTPKQVRDYFCAEATDSEISFFIRFCLATQSNPFLREVWLIKYDKTKPAAIVVGKDRKLRIAYDDPHFSGMKAGIITQVNKDVHRLEGAFIPPDHTLVGGWAEVSRSDRGIPVRIEVALSEAAGLSHFWRDQPANMIRKVALSRALSEAFPFLSRVRDVSEVPNDLPSAPVAWQPPEGAEDEAEAVDPDTGEISQPATSGVADQAPPSPAWDILNSLGRELGWNNKTLRTWLTQGGFLIGEELREENAGRAVDALSELLSTRERRTAST